MRMMCIEICQSGYSFTYFIQMVQSRIRMIKMIIPTIMMQNGANAISFMMRICV